MITPSNIGSEEVCFEANPTLWQMFCLLTSRDPMTPNYNWQERDVVDFILGKIK